MSSPPSPIGLLEARAAKEALSPDLMAIPGVQGVGIGLTLDKSRYAVIVYLKDQAASAGLERLGLHNRGVEIVPKVTGAFLAA